MAEQLRGREVPKPRSRVLRENPDQRGYFFPGEVAQMTGFTEIDYRQLRRLFRLVRTQIGLATPTDKKWSRYTLRDIAALRIAVALCRDEGSDSSYLLIKPLEQACDSLRRQGVQNPLLDVPMVREGRTVFAEIDGVLINPANGQMQLRDVTDTVRDYLDRVDLGVPPEDKASVRAAIRLESRYPMRSRDRISTSGARTRL